MRGRLKKKDSIILFCKDKKAISTIIITLLLIVMVLVAIGILWAVVKNIIDKSVIEISLLEGSKIDLKIVSFGIDENIFNIKVIRKLGGGNLIGIKFVFSNATSSIVVGQILESEELEELEEKTFYFNLAEIGIINLKKIAVAPVVGSSGESMLLGITDTVDVSDSFDLEICIPETLSLTCDLWVCGDITNNCGDQVSCGICSEGECINGACEVLGGECVEESDCGTDNWVEGSEICNGGVEVWQDWVDYSCEVDECSFVTNSVFKEACGDGEICINGECFIEIECANNNDCYDKEINGQSCETTSCICNEISECEVETVIDNGVIYSIWPYLGGKYFDSVDLPVSGVDYTGNYIGFTGAEIRCLTISNYVIPYYPEINNLSYIEIDANSTSIQPGDYYEVWKTLNGCTLNSGL